MFTFIGEVAIGIFIVIIRGWAFTMLWTWFIVPAFHTTEISVPVAIGISIMSNLFIATYPSDKVEWEDLFAFNMILTTIAIAFGYVVHLFI